MIEVSVLGCDSALLCIWFPRRSETRKVNRLIRTISYNVISDVPFDTEA